MKSSVSCTKRLLLAYLIFSPLLLSTVANSAAWTLPKGKAQAIHNFYYYRTDTFVNGSGVSQSQDPFDKFEHQVLTEYGWRDDVTLGSKISHQYVAQSANQDWEVVSAEFFLRKRLFNQDEQVFSIQPLIKIPGTFDEDDPNNLFGEEQIDLELRALGGMSGLFQGEEMFGGAELAYRKRFHDPADEVHLDLTGGWKIDEDWTAMAQLFTRASIDGIPNSPNQFQNTNASDNKIANLQLSLAYKIGEHTALQLGWFKHMRVRNTGRGGGLLLSIWRDCLGLFCAGDKDKK